jgi:hypothetical protein
MWLALRVVFVSCCWARIKLAKVKQAGAGALLAVKVGLRRGHVRLQLPTTVFVVEVQVGSTVDWVHFKELGAEKT